ncbi:MAG: YkvA family protein [bacterium]
MGIVETWKQRARQLRTDVHALYLAYRDPRVPWYGRLLAACVVAFAFSPIDLIPDPIPVLGYLDDLVLIPLGVALVLRMMPPGVMAEARAKARAAAAAGTPTNWVAATIIVAIWLLLVVVAVRLVLRVVRD